ncbi:hypothetical protein F4780DRAFT_625278 [Xylariomycetidae sp. FL0641]|nr:hypothetical protein F4780DRAFT_625278 [Xylariomycetidae sp. FL0641]
MSGVSTPADSTASPGESEATPGPHPTIDALFAPASPGPSARPRQPEQIPQQSLPPLPPPGTQSPSPSHPNAQFQPPPAHFGTPGQEHGKPLLPSPHSRTHPGTPRPKGIHTKHLTELERFRVRTLYYDACLTKKRIQEITGYSESQIRTAVRAKTAAVGKRSGRPRKGYRPYPENTAAPAASEEEASAELIQQAQNYFTESHDDSMVSVDDNVDTRDSDPSRKGFNDLPPDIRINIWKMVLCIAPFQMPIVRSWALAVLNASPWLQLDFSPPGVQLTNPPWNHYTDNRHGPATALCMVNREAREVVLERLTPIRVAPTIHLPYKYVWVDQHLDNNHFFGAPVYPGLFERAGKAASPTLYARLD